MNESIAMHKGATAERVHLIGWLKDDYVGCGVLARRELQVKVEAREQQNLVLLREIERLQQQVRHSYRGSLFCSSEGTI